MQRGQLEFPLFAFRRLFCDCELRAVIVYQQMGTRVNVLCEDHTADQGLHTTLQEAAQRTSAVDSMQSDGGNHMLFGRVGQKLMVSCLSRRNGLVDSWIIKYTTILPDFQA